MPKSTLKTRLRDEWPTLALLVTCYVVFFVVTALPMPLGLAVLGLALVTTLHSSLQHEVLHGHPTQSEAINHALVFLPIGLFVPYLRFRDQHLAHHYDPNLTDPYEDPESNFLDPEHWRRLPRLGQLLFTLNNMLAGRMVLGPVMSIARLYLDDLCVMLTTSAPRLWLSYGLHFLGVGIVGAWHTNFGTLPLWAILAGAYGGLMVLRIRTFLEHRAEERAAARSVIIEDRGLLALLFLNNNYHALHHAHPSLAWHRLPALYEAQKDRILKRNEGYRYKNYAEIFRLYLFRRKDPVAHPLMAVGQPTQRAHTNTQAPVAAE